MKHQALRDAIRNLMKANDSRILDITNAGELITSYESGATSELSNQNIKLQAILDAHKQPLSDERKNNDTIDAYRS